MPRVEEFIAEWAVEDRLGGSVSDVRLVPGDDLLAVDAQALLGYRPFKS